MLRCQLSSWVVFNSPKCGTRRCNTRLRLTRRLSQSEIINVMLTVFKDAVGFKKHPRIFSTSTHLCLWARLSHAQKTAIFCFQPRKTITKKIQTDKIWEG